MRSTLPVFTLVFGLCGSLVAACSSNDGGAPSDGGADAAAFSASAAFSGPPDSHCGTKAQTLSDASCHPDAAAAPAEDSGATDASTADGSSSDGGSAEAGGDDTGGDGYGVTMNNAEGDDDDCKYHIKWLSSPVAQNTDVTFQVTVTKKSGNAALVGGTVFPEVFLSDTHVGPDTKPKSVDMGNGVYQVSPVRFYQAGKWTVRFHINEECEDTLDDSPHGHGAFYVVVP